MYCHKVSNELLTTVQARTKDAFTKFSIQEVELAPHLATASGRGEMFKLNAKSWKIGTDLTLGECRCVYIRGSNSEIINTMIFPITPGALPVFVADLLATSGQFRVVFLDLQIPGLSLGKKAELASRINSAATNKISNWDSGQAPEWATDWSTGNYLFGKPTATPETQCVFSKYDQWLKLWVEIAQDWPCTEISGDFAEQEVVLYKREHIEKSPAGPYLTRLFGSSWANQFLTDFLYS